MTTTLRSCIVTSEDVGKPVLVWWLDDDEKRYYAKSILLQVGEKPSDDHLVYGLDEKGVQSISFDQIVKVGDASVEVLIDFD